MNLIKEVQEKVFNVCFANGNFREGRDILKRLSFKINEDSTIEEKRMVIYNLAWVNYHLKDIGAAKFYIDNIKKEFEENKFYCKKEFDKYNKILHLYIDIYDDELSIAEKLNIENKILKSYAHSNHMIGVSTSRFNIAMLKEDFKGIERSLKGLHTYSLINLKSKEDRMRCDTIISDMLEKLRTVNEEWEQEICLTLTNNKARLTSISRNVSGEVF